MHHSLKLKDIRTRNKEVLMLGSATAGGVHISQITKQIVEGG